MPHAPDSDRRAAAADDPLLWIALASVPGLSRRRAGALLARYGSPSALFRASEAQLLAAGVAEEPAHALARGPQRRAARRLLRAAERAGARVLARDSAGFPSRLREVPDPPLVLYVRGPLPEGPAAAIVGGRRASPRARTAAREFARELGRRGVAVVSGLALGIDGEAHRGALEAEAATVAALASGVDRPTPWLHRELARRILDGGGALCSEHPPGTRSLPRHFPERNRLISGLADVALIVEAREKSGSLWTARHAMEQGRDVFALPGPTDSDACRGSNALLRDGAGVALAPRDLAFALGVALDDDAVPEVAAVPEGPAADVIALLRDGPLDPDTLGRRLGLSHAELAPVLLDLELEGAIERRGARIAPRPARGRRPH